MTTLHQYRWTNLRHCQQRLHFIDEQDDLLIYGSFTTEDQLNLLNETAFLAGRCFWHSDRPSELPEIQNINYNQWLTLITEHDKTYTWK